MPKFHRPSRSVAFVAATVTGLVLVAPNSALADGHRGHNKLDVSQVNLVSDIPGMASVFDKNLVNPWGLAIGPTSPIWSANNGTDTATLYSSAPGSTTASIVPLVVSLPAVPPPPVELPTGQVFNGSATDFLVTAGNPATAGRFIFSTLTGHIDAWSPAADPTHTVLKANVTGAAYTGLALATSKSGAQLYAANFGQGTVDVFDSTFKMQSASKHRFHDRHLPKGYSPFGIATLDDNLFVAYAKVDPVTHRNAVGKGLGFVDEFTPEGRLVGRVASRHTLNAPWGLEIAPPSWGKLAGDLLVGNFGDGKINVIEAEHHRGEHARFDGEFEGLLHNAATGKTLVIPGLWALLQGKDSPNGAGSDSIWFSAGIDNETHGLIGVLRHP